MKLRSRALHVCTLNPMIPNEYHISTNIAETRMRTFLFTTCKDRNFLIIFAMTTKTTDELKSISS